jgi:hypothetical protein
MTTTTTTPKISKLGFFFFPKFAVILPIIAEGIRNGAEKLQFFGSYEGHIFDAMDYIVTRFKSAIEGEINLKYLHTAIKEVASVFDMAKFIASFSESNNWSGAKNGKAESYVSLIGIGVLNADYKDGDSDPYETAGGYRSWIALKGTTVKYYLNRDLTFTLMFDSNCLVDHYNNNFCGVSTGGGTTEYKLGQRVETRSITLGREAFDKGWTKAKIDATATRVDFAKLKKLAAEYVPEFAFVFEK